MFENETDEELMVLYLAGNERAFEALFARYRNRVYGYVDKYIKDPRVADDLFQIVFLKLHRSRTRFDTRLLFGPWLFTICRNVIFDHLRGTQRSRERLGKAEDAMEIATTIQEEEPDTALEELLKIVPDRQREAVRLRYEEGLDFEAIAHRLNTTQENARQLISRAVRAIKKRVNRK